ncbi:MAG: response regulator transcription factor [Verrucomicrobia bacterium]|nr:response regulator transcription factor [Verrucomicrobiota bacterium]
MAIAVSIVEDDPDLRAAMTTLIRGTPNFHLLGAYGSAEEAFRIIPQCPPDVVLMDIHLPKLSGIECVRQLKAQLPDLVIVMLTVSDSADDVFPALAAGASGYLLKRTPPAKLLEAIEEVHQHGSPMSPPIARLVVQTFFQRDKPVAESLTEREELILRKLAKGWRYKEIATDLGVGVETVHTHIRHIYAKLHVTSRTEAVVKYLGR